MWTVAKLCRRGWRPACRRVVTKRRARNRWIELALFVVVLIGGAGGAYYWWRRLHPALPAGIFFGNGRLEADEINIDTKYAARIGEMLADEGDMVKAGQVVARMDTRDLQASLKRSQATVQQSKRAVDEANANLAQQKTQVLLAQQEYDRAAYTVQKGVETKELLDQRKQQLDGAQAALLAAQDRVTETEHALEAATHDVELYNVEINDDTLVAPRDGRIQYRIANLGEVLPAGGHVFAMLDISDVYMDVYLPTDRSGKGEIRRRRPHRARRLSRLRHSGQGVVHRHPGAVHSQDGGDPERARRADVPRPRATGSGTIAPARGSRAQRTAGRRLRQRPIRPWHGRRRCKGSRRNERCDQAGRARWTRSRSVMREPWRSTRSVSKFPPDAWSA